MKRLVIASSALFAFGAAASAAVLPVKAPLAPVAAIQSWTGWYAGLNAGAVFGDESVSWSAAPGFSGFNAAGAADIIASSPANVRSTGFTGGGQIGYNFQVQSLVVGPEADLQYTGINGSRSFLSTAFQDPYTQAVQSNWLSTIRGRAGVANQSWLFYGTAGLAVGQTNFTDNFVGLHGIGPISSSVSGTHAGWAAGAGAEVMIERVWSIKLEYLHVDLGSQSDVAQSQINLATITHSHSFTEDIVRIGVNRHWGP